MILPQLTVHKSEQQHGSRLKLWWRKITHKDQAKCICGKKELKRFEKKSRKKHKKSSKSKQKPIAIPKFYVNETKTYMWVGGRRVPYTPAQVNFWKEERNSFEPIKEERYCYYCHAIADEERE